MSVKQSRQYRRSDLQPITRNTLPSSTQRAFGMHLNMHFPDLNTRFPVPDGCPSSRYHSESFLFWLFSSPSLTLGLTVNYIGLKRHSEPTRGKRVLLREHSATLYIRRTKRLKTQGSFPLTSRVRSHSICQGLGLHPCIRLISTCGSRTLEGPVSNLLPVTLLIWKIRGELARE